ncbi:transposase [Vibrio thalassae]
MKDEFPKANVTVDWFHVVQLFTRAVDVHISEHSDQSFPQYL